MREMRQRTRGRYTVGENGKRPSFSIDSRSSFPSDAASRRRFPATSLSLSSLGEKSGLLDSLAKVARVCQLVTATGFVSLRVVLNSAFGSPNKREITNSGYVLPYPSIETRKEEERIKEERENKGETEVVAVDIIAQREIPVFLFLEIIANPSERKRERERDVLEANSRRRRFGPLTRSVPINKRAIEHILRRTKLPS